MAKATAKPKHKPKVRKLALKAKARAAAKPQRAKARIAVKGLHAKAAERARSAKFLEKISKLRSMLGCGPQRWNQQILRIQENQHCRTPTGI